MNWSGRVPQQVVVERFGRRSPAQGLAWAGVERESDRGEIVGAVLAQVGAFRGVLAQQAIGVLVRAPLPRTVRMTEEDLQVGVDAQVRRRSWWSRPVGLSRPSLAKSGRTSR